MMKHVSPGRSATDSSSHRGGGVRASACGRARAAGAAALFVLVSACGDVPSGSDALPGAGDLDADVPATDVGRGEDPARPDASPAERDAGEVIAPSACEDGTFDHDHDPATECIPWSSCAAGTYVTSAPSATSDRTCAACASGTFSATSNEASCKAWSSCKAGTFVSTEGSTTTDRACTPCSGETYSSSDNQASCVPVGACPAGTEQTAPATETAPPVCTPCELGTYCAGATAPKKACANGTWDHDSDPATTCVAWTQCVAGQAVAVAGNASTDRTCTGCASGTFSTENNAVSCAAWSSCAAGTYVSTPGTTKANRQCKACATGTYSAAANQTTCLAQGACAAGSEQTTPATSTSPPVCADCNAGTYCAGGAAPKQPCADGTWDHDTNPATACAAWTGCEPGQSVATEGDATTNRTCASCASAHFSTTANAASCVAWADCQPGSYVTANGTATTDRQCAACPVNQTSTTTNAASCAGWPVELAAGGSHTCARLSDGSVQCWGDNYQGQLGDGTTGGNKSSPIAVSGLSGVAELTAGDSHTCVRLSEGSVKCWGSNAGGKLGDGTYVDKSSPTAVPNLAGVAELSAGAYHTCVRLSDGSVQCWGYPRSSSST